MLESIWNLATVMMQGYAQAYPAEDFQIVALEKGFQGPIINSDSRLASQPRARTPAPFCSPARSQRATPCGRHRAAQRPALPAGAQDRRDSHLASSMIDGAYLERLWTDFQITLYTGYLEKVLGIRITGIIYNVLAKAKLRQSKGETEVEYEARCAELIDGLARCEPNPRSEKPAPSANFTKPMRSFRNVWPQNTPNPACFTARCSFCSATAFRNCKRTRDA